MSSKLPVLKPKEIVAALERADYKTKRQSGSHSVLHKPGFDRLITVPIHTKDMPLGTLRAIIRQANLTVDEFMSLL